MSPHPLAPLSSDEIAAAVAVLTAAGAVGTDPRFAWVALAEPDKAALLAGSTPPRRAECVVVDRATGVTHEAVVDLDARRIERADALDGLHGPVLYEEWTGAARVLSDARVAAALAVRGLDDHARLHLEPWPLGPAEERWGARSRRLGRVTFFVRDLDRDTAWARPVEGLIAVADRVTGEVVELIDAGVVPVPADPFPIVSEDRPLRTDVAALSITQPDGPGFTVDGYVLRWQRWEMVCGFHPLEGLVLRDVRYHDPVTGTARSVLWRASVSEMVVPYGDPTAMHAWRHVFDAGEVGLGRNATSLTLGCDCLGEIRYLDAHMVDADGTPTTIANAVCLHEEDDGVLWRHYDSRTDTTAVRRRRRFVVSSWTNLGNYDYGFYWSFHQDGTIEAEVRLTGVPLASAVAPGSSPAHGTLMADGVSAPHHQHLFSFRLDLDVDGPGNTVEEVDLEALPVGPANPTGTAMATRHTPLTAEGMARRIADPLAGRAWVVRNPSVLGATGAPVGYKILPGASPLLLAAPGSAVAARAGFARHHLWVTAYDEHELRAAGPYPNQHPGGAGLPGWAAADRPLVDADVVLWLTCGVDHVVRPEDWPVMPTARTGFVMEPVGFFAHNPALDVPPERGGHAGHCHV